MSKNIGGKRLEQGKLVNGAGKKYIQRPHGFVGLDRANARVFHALAILVGGNDADIAPEPPVHHLDRTAPCPTELLRVRVLKRAACRVVALAGGLGEALQRREKQHEIQLLSTKYLGEPDACIYLCLQRPTEARFVHAGNAAVEQDDSRMHHPMNARMQCANLVETRLQRGPVDGVTLQVERRFAKLAQTLLARANGLVEWSTANPHHARIVLSNQVFRVHLADTAGSADDHVNAALAVGGR